ncbi:MAG: amino acid permease [Spirochaetes bacterium]|nr:amino acid permease [Spirochaetota bacterium]
MGLKRELTLFDVFCIASGAMISSGIFILPGVAYAKAGTAVIISYMLAGLLSLPGMLSIAEMTTAMPKAGGDCFAVMRSMGPAVGTVAGLLSWFSLSMKSAFALIGMSVFTGLFIAVDIRYIAVFFCLVFLLVNIIGVKQAGRMQVVLVAGLLGLMILYIVKGVPSVRHENLAPFSPHGIGAVLATSGFVFVSYAGLLKVASIAEEIRNPGRNIPLAMILSLVVVGILYIMMVFVTVGVLPASILVGSLTPISDGAAVFFGPEGAAALGIAAVLAFLSTANAGIMTAARSLVPLSRDNLFPRKFEAVHKKFQTPYNALFLTGFFIMITLFLRLEILVEAASTVLILTNILSCLSIIILRESRLQNYRPTFRAPLYPWMQIAGIAGLVSLVFEMGKEALLISLVLILGGVFLYWFYGRIRGYREYALLHLIESITAKELTDRSLETELKEIIRDRDNITKDRFDEVIEGGYVLDLSGKPSVRDFFRVAAGEMAKAAGMNRSELFRFLEKRENESSTVITPFLAVPHIVIEGTHRFSILLARCRQGIMFSDEFPSVHAVFVLLGTKDERNFHLISLAAIAQIVQEPGFERRWMSAKNKESLRDILLLGERKRS